MLIHFLAQAGVRYWLEAAFHYADRGQKTPLLLLEGVVSRAAGDPCILRGPSVNYL